MFLSSMILEKEEFHTTSIYEILTLDMMNEPLALQSKANIGISLHSAVCSVRATPITTPLLLLSLVHDRGLSECVLRGTHWNLSDAAVHSLSQRDSMFSFSVTKCVSDTRLTES